VNPRDLIDLKRINRTEFIAWCDGILLDFKKGVGIAPNELLCKEAEAALEHGDPVLLTGPNGKVVSYCTLDKAAGGYLERPISELLENNDA
jgi:hypothetical protein